LSIGSHSFDFLGLLPNPAPLIFHRTPNGKEKMEDTPPGKLFAHALALAQGVSLETLYEKTRLPISWLRKFRGGMIQAPSVQRVELVIVRLTGNEIL
jgi:hypothetical protein